MIKLNVFIQLISGDGSFLLRAPRESEALWNAATLGRKV